MKYKKKILEQLEFTEDQCQGAFIQHSSNLLEPFRRLALSEGIQDPIIFNIYRCPDRLSYIASVSGWRWIERFDLSDFQRPALEVASGS